MDPELRRFQRASGIRAAAAAASGDWADTVGPWSRSAAAATRRCSAAFPKTAVSNNRSGVLFLLRDGAPDFINLDLPCVKVAHPGTRNPGAFLPDADPKRMMVSRWSPVTRSIARIRLSSASIEIASTFFSVGRLRRRIKSVLSRSRQLQIGHHRTLNGNESKPLQEPTPKANRIQSTKA